MVVVSIKDKIEQRSNQAMVNRFNNQAALVRSLRSMLSTRYVELINAGVSSIEINRFIKELRKVYGDNKAMAMGGNIDEHI